MKVLFAFILFVAMGAYMYNQYSTITDLQSSLTDEQAKSTQLQTDLDTAKKALAAMQAQAQAQGRPAYVNPLSKGAATPVPTAAADWMWKVKTPLDNPKQ